MNNITAMLTAAAERLRTVAEQAISVPWSDSASSIAAATPVPDADWIATMSPLVAGPIAAWLEYESLVGAERTRHWAGSFEDGYSAHAVQLARIILGESR